MAAAPVATGCLARRACGGWSSSGGSRASASASRRFEECLAVHDAGELPCGDIQRQLQRQIDLVDERLGELRQFRSELQCLLENWRSDPAPNAAVICPNLNV
jgi:5'-deoxynucleotidase YfbR-like HD superfamily hydrolase